MSARVFVTRRIPDAGLAPLREAGLAVDVYDSDEAITRSELLRRAAGAAALVTLLSERVDDELLDAAGPGLRVVANYAVGYDNVDVAACSRRGVTVTNTPDVLTEATADMAFALLLAAARRVVEGDALVRSGAWTGWQPEQLLGVPVAGTTIGLIGMGRIGTAVAKRARGFAMKVVFYGRGRHEEAEDELGAERLPLDELLATSDFVSVNVPLTPETRHLIGARELALMKPTAVLVNTARGPVIDEAALAAALAEERIFAAGLDVFEREPAVHGGLLGLKNVVLAPHLGSATVRARTDMALLCARAVVDVLAGRTPPNLVRP